VPSLPYLWTSPEGRLVPGSVYLRAVDRLLAAHQQELLELIADEKERRRSGFSYRRPDEGDLT
jgi:hypothetical protein